MMRELLQLFLFLTFGGLVGIAHLHLLRLQVEALGGGRGGWAGGLRLVVTPAALGLAAGGGGAALLAVLAGFLIARTAIVRQVWVAGR